MKMELEINFYYYGKLKTFTVGCPAYESHFSSEPTDDKVGVC